MGSGLSRIEGVSSGLTDRGQSVWIRALRMKAWVACGEFSNHSWIHLSSSCRIRAEEGLDCLVLQVLILLAAGICGLLGLGLQA